MGTKIHRSDFRKQFASAYQGLFIFPDSKHILKDQPTINLGYELSKRLKEVHIDKRSFKIDACLHDIVEDYKSVTLTNIEVLFTPSLKQDVIGILLALCRNRKICITWPGCISGQLLKYAEPGGLEYYEADYTRFIDTYLIAE